MALRPGDPPWAATRAGQQEGGGPGRGALGRAATGSGEDGDRGGARRLAAPGSNHVSGKETTGQEQ